MATNWRPADWLAFRGNFGVDYINRVDTQICRFAECASVTDQLGFKVDNRTNFFIYTLDAGATATRRFSETIESQTTAGVQFYRNVFDRNGALGRTLPPGAVTVTAGAVQTADEATSDSRTLGGFLEQRVAFSDRLFLTGAVRSDRNSAFGKNFKTVFYPKLSASWVVSQEPRFPEIGFINELRLRSAYGASGVQPGNTDAVAFFVPTAIIGESGEQPGLVFSSLGNANLRPERSSEWEVGFDASLWDNRLTTEFTYYNKKSRDALVGRVLPPSLGASASRFENLGRVSNWGWETLVTAQLLRHRNLGWEVTLNGSHNLNNLDSLGGVPNIGTGSTQQREKYPLNGWWARRLVSYDDANKDGIIVRSEIVVTDTTVYHGTPAPTYEFALSNGFDLFDKRVRVAAMIDYKGGHLVYNNTERIRCASRNNCAALIDKNNSTLFEQARTVMVREVGSIGGFLEPGDFLRFRELSVSGSIPERYVDRLLRANAATLSLGVRNLGMLWSRYTGTDPEAFGTTGDAPSSFQAFAPPTYYTLRLSLTF
jgi:outer membrane receptor protein involved in Fe transport